MRMFIRNIKTLSSIVLFFFMWTFGPLFQIPAAIAADQQGGGSRRLQPAQNAKTANSRLATDVRPTSGERFEKALESIRENVGRAGDKAERGEDDKNERANILVNRAEIDALDVDLRKEFSATEKKLKDAKLPKEILDRHYKFVKHYEDNLNELKTNLDDIEKATTKSDRKARIAKTRLHLEKTRTPSKHVPLDPNKLPNRLVKGKERAPRLKKEEFEKEFRSQRTQKKTRTAEILDADQRGWTRILDAAFQRAASRLTPNPSRPLLAYNSAIASDMPLDLRCPAAEGRRCLPSDDLIGGEGTLAFPAYSSSELNPQLLLAQATPDIPTATDLAETIEVTFSDELGKIVRLLDHDPVLIYEYVKNNFEYEPYYGSLKGAQQTLLEQAGNDIDQASLLIALYRSIGIPTRYVYGTISLPAGQAMTWLGAPDEETAFKMLASNGIPVARNIDGTMTNIQLEHVWIEAYISYDDYRGKGNFRDSNHRRWIPLDPSFKTHIRNQSGINPYIASNISVDDIFRRYQSQENAKLPVQEYLSLLKTNIKQNIPDKNYYDLAWTNIIDIKEMGYLPNTLEFQTIAIGGEFSEIVDSLRHKIRFTTSNGPSDNLDLDFTVNIPELAGQRITVSFEPASPSDERIIDQYGSIYRTPPYLVQVKLILKIEGTTRATGAPIAMGVPFELGQAIIAPGGTVEDVVTFRILSGAYYAVGIDSQKMQTKTLYWRCDKYLHVRGGDPTSTERDSIVGEFLHLLLVGYFEQKDIANRFISDTMQFRDVKKTTIALMGIGLLTAYVFSVPVKCDIGSLAIDVKREISNPIDVSGANRSIRDYAYPLVTPNG